MEAPFVTEDMDECAQVSAYGDKGKSASAGDRSLTRAWFASWWSRAGAWVLDTAVVVIIAVSIRAILARSVFEESVHAFNSSFGLQLGTAMLAAAPYYPIFMRRTNGKTLGKMALHIQVVSTSGRSIGLSLAAMREVVIQVGVIGGLASLPGSVRVIGFVCALADYLWPLWDVEKRALHDMIVGTRVIDSRRIDEWLEIISKRRIGEEQKRPAFRSGSPN